MKRFISVLALLWGTSAFAQIVPADRTTTWNPGLNAVGGIPVVTNVTQTLTPSGGDDTPQINAALRACGQQGGGPVSRSAIQVLQLGAGTFNVNGVGIEIVGSGCIIRGMGPGLTHIIKQDYQTNPSYADIYTGLNQKIGTSTPLAADAVKDAFSVVTTSPVPVMVGEIVLIDQDTNNDPRVVYGPSFGTDPNAGARCWFSWNCHHAISQLVEVTAVNGTQITFATPIHITMQASLGAQLSRFTGAFQNYVGIENLSAAYGRGGDWHGGISMGMCAYCWVQNVEVSHTDGTSVGLYGAYRSVVRDSYIHTSDNPNPGGGGYLLGMNTGTSDSLFENNISAGGNKQIVMRGAGGGNVVAYNYMDDAYGSTYPESPESGLNAAHFVGTHMALLEGNYSHNYKSDTYWGNAIDITVYRNWFSALRAGAAPRPDNGQPLRTYTYVNPSNAQCIYPYEDLNGRIAVDIQAYTYNHSFVGNILGMSGQQLLSYANPSCFNGTQDAFVYEILNNFPSDNPVTMWFMGDYQASLNVPPNQWTWIATTYQTILRQGNWDFVTNSQIWYPGTGIGAQGTAGGGPAQTLPASLYLTAKPSFFGSSDAWPWTNPATGAVSILPAQYCFQQGMMPLCRASGSPPPPPPPPPPPVNGACGASNGAVLTTMPTAGLCSAGTPSPVASVGSGWAWACAGINGGTTASCSATLAPPPPPPPTNGVCGSANGVASSSAPSANLCKVGTAGNVALSGQSWKWICGGANGGATASCAAPFAVSPAIAGFFACLKSGGLPVADPTQSAGWSCAPNQ